MSQEQKKPGDKPATEGEGTELRSPKKGFENKPKFQPAKFKNPPGSNKMMRGRGANRGR